MVYYGILCKELLLDELIDFELQLTTLRNQLNKFWQTTQNAIYFLMNENKSNYFVLTDLFLKSRTPLDEKLCFYQQTTLIPGGKQRISTLRTYILNIIINFRFYYSFQMRQGQLQKIQAKNQLFQLFKTGGYQQQLKKQLRVQICQKLKQKQVINTKSNQQSQLYNRVFCSLLSQQLLFSDCGFSQSIFVVQSGYQDNMLNRNQLIQILSLKDVQLNGQSSLLSNILKKQYPFRNSTYRSNYTQTNPDQISYSLDQRFMQIDQYYRQKLTGQEKQNTKLLEKKLEDLKIIESDAKKQYERDLQRFKQFEVHRVKAQVGEIWRKKYEQMTKKLQDQYSMKMNSVRMKQRVMEEDYVRKHKLTEQNEKSIESNLKQKIQLLQLRTVLNNRQMSNLQQTEKVQNDGLRIKELELSNKIRQYDDLLLNLNKKIEQEVNMSKLALQQQYQDKQIEFMKRKKFVDEEYSKLVSIKETMEIVERDNKRVHQDNSQMRQRIKILQENIRLLSAQSTHKNQRIDHLKAELQYQKSRIKQIDESKNDIDKSKRRMEKEILELRKQLQVLRQQKEQKKDDDHEQIINQKKDERTTDLAAKLQSLRANRKKDIQKFKLDST